jgi:hypothetical protein
MQRTRTLVLGLAMAIAVFAVACSDSDASSDEEMAHGHDNGDVLAALATLNAADLHHVETTLIGDDPHINTAWLAPIRNARTAVALIAWPGELEGAADDFLRDSMPLLMALEADDLAGAAAVASDAHAAWHLLRDPGYAYLAGEAGLDSMGGDDGHGHDDDEGHDDDS